MYILSVETSCDETSVAILKNQRELKSLKVYSQIEIFKNYGGVIPEVASRNHVKKITKLIEDSLIEANLKPYDILPLIPIIKNSGAIVTNWKNEPAENGGNILATSNKILHNKILNLLKPFTKK